MEASAYSTSLLLYLHGSERSAVTADGEETKGKPYLTLPVVGTGAAPALSFDVPEVVLPIVPLGITATQTFRVVNQGYDNLELKCNLPADTERVPISVSFPEGTTLG